MSGAAAENEPVSTTRTKVSIAVNRSTRLSSQGPFTPRNKAYRCAHACRTSPVVTKFVTRTFHPPALYEILERSDATARRRLDVLSRLILRPQAALSRAAHGQ